MKDLYVFEIDIRFKGMVDVIHYSVLYQLDYNTYDEDTIDLDEIKLEFNQVMNETLNGVYGDTFLNLIIIDENGELTGENYLIEDITFLGVDLNQIPYKYKR